MRIRNYNSAKIHYETLLHPVKIEIAEQYTCQGRTDVNSDATCSKEEENKIPVRKNYNNRRQGITR